MTELSFILPLRDAGPELWRLCQSLAAGAAPGDRVIAVDGGSQDRTPALLRRFAEEQGWGPEVGFEVIALEDRERDLAELAGLGRGRARGWCLEYRAKELALAAGIASLRDLLRGREDDIVLANHAWYLAGAGSPLPCPDAPRWPTTGTGPARAAQSLMPDPRRLVCRAGSAAAAAFSGNGAPAERYAALLAELSEVGFCAAPVRLAPLPPDPGLTGLQRLLATLGQLPATADTTALAPPLLRAGDDFCRLAPGQAEAWLETAQEGLSALPRRLRKTVCAHDSPVGRLLGILQREGRGAARCSLSLILAEAQRQQADALRAEIAQLRLDLDLALPGADYLERLRARARRI